MKLIGITGKKRSGKDTVAGFIKQLASQKGLASCSAGFADALKQEVAQACGVTVDFIEENKELFRPILQWWGTDFRRKLCGDKYWIHRMEATLRHIEEQQHAIAIVTDVRFHNEAQMVWDQGGIVLRVWRPGLATDTHSREHDMDGVEVDGTIGNPGSLGDLLDLTPAELTRLGTLDPHKPTNNL